MAINQVTTAGVKEGGSLTLIVIFMSIGIDQVSAGEMVTGGIFLGVATLLTVMREYIKPN